MASKVMVSEPDIMAPPEPMVGNLKFSVVIPVYNSEQVVGDTIKRTVQFFEQRGWNYEVILVNDGSKDRSWEVISAQARDNSHLLAINLLKNYGQHTANFCGFAHVTGDYVITLDDDLQNPPEEIIHLVHKALEGHDLVFGRFYQKQHAAHRRLGTVLIGLVNKRIFGQPDDLYLTNFRIIRRDVIDRMCAYRTNYPYTQGLSLMFATNPANTWVRHDRREVGVSNYNFITIFRLVMRILFNYSAYPLQIVSVGGMLIALVSFVTGLIVLLKALIVGTNVPGWATTIVLMSFLNGVLLLTVSMLGEYLVRLINQVSAESYYIKEKVRKHA